MLASRGNGRKELREANAFMMAGNKNAAKKSLETLLVKFGHDKTIYADVVNIYLAGQLFKEAQAVFEAYANRFGGTLSADFTVSDIQREQAKYENAASSYAATPVKLFRRMSIVERGRVSHRPTIFPIREIRISDDGLVLRKRRNEYRYTWSDILGAYITNRRGYKGYLFSDDIIRTLHFRTADAIFKIDVSAKFPDFKDTPLLLEELARRLVLRQE
jgi:hypothetical protein